MNQKQNPKFDENKEEMLPKEILKKKRKIEPLHFFAFIFGFALAALIFWLFWILDDTFFVLVILFLNVFWFYQLYLSIKEENKKENSKGKMSFTLYLAFSIFIYWFCWLLFIKYPISIIFTTPLLLTCIFFGIHKIKSQKEELSLKFDENGEEILWESKKQFEFVSLGFFVFELYATFFLGFMVWISLEKSFWFIIFILLIDYVCIKEIFAMLSFKAMLITQKGLTLKTKWFNEKIFYPYGSFVITDERAGLRSLCSKMMIFSTKYTSKSFVFPCIEVFKNIQKFKELCTQYTELALETMDIKEKVELYKLYRANIEIAWGYEEINYKNVFKINFNPYLEELKAYFCKEKQEMLKNMDTPKRVINYKICEKLYKKTKSLEFDTSYFEPYLQEIQTYLKNKK